MPAVGCKIAMLEMYLMTDLPTFGYAKWRSTVIIQNLKNVLNANYWPIVVTVLQLQVEGMETFMRLIRNVGRRLFDYE